MSGASLYVVLGVSAWIAATVAPPAIAFASWILARRLRPSWAVHVLFVPFLLLTEWLLIDAVSFAAHDDGEGPPGLGVAILPALGLIVVSICAYCCALLAKWIVRVRRRA